MKKLRWCDYELECSGEELYINNGFVGINDELTEISSGYDDVIYMDGNNHCSLTNDELSELAIEMIDRWQRFYSKLVAKKR